MANIVLKTSAFTLQLRHPFAISSNVRSSTPIVLVTLFYDGLTAYGEASLPPYLSETQESVLSCLAQLDLQQFTDPSQLDTLLAYVQQHTDGQPAAQAAVDIALHDLYGKINRKALHQFWGYSDNKIPLSSFTIGIDTDEIIRLKTREAAAYPILKVKLDGKRDRNIINAIRSQTNVPLYVDANQAWTDPHYAIDTICWLAEQNVLLVEQPLPVHLYKEMAYVHHHSPLPCIADESLQNLSDLEQTLETFSGINIKLMKCGGLQPARELIKAAKKVGLEVMLGCMTESSCAISAAAQIASEAKWLDLDGALLISNDPFTGTKITNGLVQNTDDYGLGINPLSNF